MNNERKIIIKPSTLENVNTIKWFEGKLRDSFYSTLDSLFESPIPKHDSINNEKDESK